LRPEYWCLWNGLFGQVQTQNLVAGNSLYASFNIIPNVSFPNGTTLPPPSIRLVNTTKSGSEFGWIYKFVTPKGITSEFGRHNYGVYPLNDKQTCFVTWEKVAGPTSDNNPLAAEEFDKTFLCANAAALDGARCLEYVFMTTGDIVSNSVSMNCHNWTGYGCTKKPTDAVDCLPHTYPPQI